MTTTPEITSTITSSTTAPISSVPALTTDITAMTTTHTTTLSSISAPSHPERIAYLFGTPIDHSLSPMMHQTVYNALGLPWTQFRFSSSNVEDFMASTRKDPRFYGSAVTMPNKLTIMPQLDELTEEARDVGAVNTIFLRDREAEVEKRVFVGTNTDVVGIRESFYQNVPDAESRFPTTPGLVIGGGGAARSAVYSLHKHLRCNPIYIANRDTSEVDAVIAHCRTHNYGENLIHLSSVAQARAFSASETPTAIVSCIPDLQPRSDAEKEVRGIVEEVLGREGGADGKKGVILEMAYHPRPFTALAGIAQRAGWQVLLGTEAMIYQGLEQDRLWTGRELKELPVQEVKSVINGELEARY